MATIAVSTGWLHYELLPQASAMTSCNCFQHWLAAKQVSTGMLQLLSALAGCTTKFCPRRQRQMSKQAGKPNVIATCQL
jgi:hypothetical protein